VSEGNKFDQGKVRLELLPPEALYEVSRVLMHGAGKYGDFNWAGGMKWTRLLGATLRHTFAFLRGEDKDPESGLSHLAHACCGLLFLIEYQTLHPELDDRYKRTPHATIDIDSALAHSDVTLTRASGAV
jgi:hypothetical protein